MRLRKTDSLEKMLNHITVLTGTFTSIGRVGELKGGGGGGGGAANNTPH